MSSSVCTYHQPIHPPFYSKQTHYQAWWRPSPQRRKSPRTRTGGRSRRPRRSSRSSRPSAWARHLYMCAFWIMECMPGAEAGGRCRGCHFKFSLTTTPSTPNQQHNQPTHAKHTHTHKTTRLGEILPAIRGLGASATIASVSNDGVVGLSFQGPDKVRLGVVYALKALPGVTDVVPAA